MALDFGNKVENGGIPPQGVLTANEFNELVAQVNQNEEDISQIGTPNSIESIEATESQASGGNNVITITETNGTETSFNVKNGNDGANGVSLGDVEIADNLTTDDATKVLSAKQGKVLKDLVDSQTFPIADNLTTEDASSALSAKQGVVLKNYIDSGKGEKNLNKKLLGTIVTDSTAAVAFRKYIDLPRNLFDKKMFIWFAVGSDTSYAMQNYAAGVNNGVATQINNSQLSAMHKIWDGNDQYKIAVVDCTVWDGYDTIRLSLYNKDDTFINALFIGSDLDADYTSWDFVKLKTIPPVTSAWYRGESAEIKAVVGDRVKPSNVDYTHTSRNLYNPYEKELTDWAVASPFYPIYYSGFIPVAEETLYTLTRNWGTSAGIRFYNSNKVQIGTSAYFRHTTPSGCAYVRFQLSAYGSGLDCLEIDAKVQYEKGEATPFQPHFYFDSEAMSSALAGKIFATMGDSFSAPNKWQAKMCALLSATNDKKTAIDGGKWSGTANNSAYTQAQAMVTYYNTVASGQTDAPTKPDYFLCLFGVNDIANNVALGEIAYSDTIGAGGIDTSTITGGIQATLKTLKDNFTNSIIKVGFTPGGMQYLSANATTYAAVTELIARLKEVADLYAVGYIETRAVGMCQIVQSEYEAYRKSAQDNHPNDAGQDRIGEYMARIMLSNL